jgi:hypothetical protein
VVELAEHDQVEALVGQLGDALVADVGGERAHAGALGDGGQLAQPLEQPRLERALVLAQDAHENTFMMSATCMSTSSPESPPASACPVSL